MSKLASQRALWAVAIACVAAGAALTVRTFARAGELRGLLRAKAKAVQELRDIASDLNRYSSARAAFEQIERRTLIPLEGMLEVTMKPSRPEGTRQTRSEIAPGWTLRREEISFGEVPLLSVMQFLRGVELQRPPWRLAKCIVRASSHTPGQGRVVVLLEGLERTPAGKDR